MSLSPQLLRILVCPRCKGQLEYQEGRDGAAAPPSPEPSPVPEPSLVCHTCRLRYPVRDDIPIMLVDEAAPL